MRSYEWPPVERPPDGWTLRWQSSGVLCVSKSDDDDEFVTMTSADITTGENGVPIEVLDYLSRIAPAFFGPEHASMVVFDTSRLD